MKVLIILTIWIILSVLSTRFKRYQWNVLIALDQLMNSLLFGYPEETLSARTYRKAKAGQWFWRALRQVIDLAFRWDSAEHCREAYENELKRAQGPREYQV